MEENDLRQRSGIPLGHKFFAILFAAGVAAAGCAWLMYQSRIAASTAVLAFSPEGAQRVDPGIGSAAYPAVALADLKLTDQAVAGLAKQVGLSASTPAGQIGEFRSDLQLKQASPQQLEVRFTAADAPQSMDAANVVAHALADWNPNSASAAAAATAPEATPESQNAAPGETTAVPSSAPGAASASQAAVANPGPSAPPGSPISAGTQPAGATVPNIPLSQQLHGFGLQLAAINQQMDRLGGGSPTGADESSYVESAQQSLLRVKVKEAQQRLKDLRTRYAKALADPAISGAVNEIQQALDSILSGRHASGFNTAGVSTAQLTAERSELRQAVRIVNNETKRVQSAEAAHPGLGAPTNASPAPAQAASAGAPAALPAPPPASTQPPAPAVQEQNIPATSSNGQAAQASSQAPLSVVRLAAPRPRPPLWPAIAAGAFCGLLYFGIAAIAYRRKGGDEDYVEVSPGPQRMITVADPIRYERQETAEREPPPMEPSSRHRAAFVFQPEPAKNGSGEKPPARVDAPAAPAASVSEAAENAVATAEGAEAKPDAEAALNAVPVESAGDGGSPNWAGETAASAELSRGQDAVALTIQEADLDVTPLPAPAAEAANGGDPVADRIRKSLANTAVAKMFESPNRAGAGN